jgi:RNA polymerase sigma-70 factor (ECF subfamily)
MIMADPEPTDSLVTTSPLPERSPRASVSETFEGFCRRVSPRLVGSLTLQLQDRGVAEDVVQEAMARAWQRWTKVSTMANPDGWVYRVAFNLALSRRRRSAAERRANARSIRPGGGPGNATGFADTTDRLVLADAVRALPTRQRAAVVLRFYGRLSVSETATVLGCAPGTVKALTSQGVHRLAEHLHVDPDELEEP